MAIEFENVGLTAVWARRIRSTPRALFHPIASEPGDV